MLLALFIRRKNLVLENILLRHQLLIYQRSIKRPKIRPIDRILLVWMSRLYAEWKKAMSVAKPETLIRWHRQGFKLYWRWLCGKPGHPEIDKELRNFIRQMQANNPRWSAQRIHGELIRLGYTVSERTIAKYMRKLKKPPSQGWRTFLKNHAGQIIAIDFFTVPSVVFKVFYVFIALSHDRRKILHFNVTDKANAFWAVQQVREATAFNENTKYIIRDNDGVYGDIFKEQIPNLGLEDTPTAKASPWQNAYCERVIGTIRRECLDHMIIFNERHLYKVLTEYIEYYNSSRTHMSLNKDSPHGRAIQTEGRITAIPVLGGLHHKYKRVS
jgi:transposase InsO family protein